MTKRWVARCSVLVLGLALAGCGWPWARRERVQAYVVHSAETACQELIRQFRKERGIRVDASYGCRRSLYETLRENRDGDIYISSSKTNLARARNEDIGAGPVVAFGELLPVIVVARGNPKQIATVGDLARPGVRVCLGAEKSCIGAVADKILLKNKLTGKIAPNVVKRLRRAEAVARSVDGKAIDAAIVWLSTVRDLGSRRVDAVPIPAEHSVVEPLCFVVLRTGKKRAEAEQLGYFLQSERAKETLTEAGLLRPKGGAF